MLAWKRSDLETLGFGRLCPKFSPDSGPNYRGIVNYKCICKVTIVFCPSIILQTWLGMVGCMIEIKLWLILETTLH
jgi:hypothetical protein